MAKSGSRDRKARGNIEHRGNSYRVRVYAGTDPLTGKDRYLRGSSTDKREAERILSRLCHEVDEQRHAQSAGALRLVVEDWFRSAELEASTRDAYRVYIDSYILPVLGDEPISKIDARALEQFYAQLRRCRQRCDGKSFVEHRVEGAHECRTVQHKRRRGRPPAGGYPEHDCEQVGCTVVECQPHVCEPLANASILKIHYIFSGTFAAAMRWGWVSSNPAEIAKKPRQPVPEPDPPTAEEAARIATAAWDQDEAWGTLIWLVMVTGLRRAELVGLRWKHVDLTTGKLSVRETYVRGRAKDTKTHRSRRISLAPATVEVLTEHRERYEQRMRQFGVEPSNEAYLFSAEPTCQRPYNPSAVTHRYKKMCTSLGIDSRLHALRHYAATELIAAGTDLRTVAGRLGHGSGGATTLRVYAAWQDEADQRAADLLESRMQRPPRQ